MTSIELGYHQNVPVKSGVNNKIQNIQIHVSRNVFLFHQILNSTYLKMSEIVQAVETSLIEVFP